MPRPGCGSATGDDDGEVIPGGEDAGDVEVVGDHPQLPVIQQGAAMASVVVPMSMKSDETVGECWRPPRERCAPSPELHHLAGAVGGIDGTRMQEAPP